jgi:hypothetical protein
MCWNMTFPLHVLIDSTAHVEAHRAPEHGPAVPYRVCNIATGQEGESAMLGELIGEFSGMITGMRVLPGDDFRYLKMELTSHASGTLLGQPAEDISTTVAYERVPGQQTYGSGQGMLMCAAGGVTYTSHGVGTMSGEGRETTVRFSAAMQAPPEGPLARLNTVLVIGEQTVDAQNRIHITLYEWK